MLNHEQIKAIYDRFGARQDSQGFYEDPPVEDLIAHARFGEAKTVFELGCGTGRLAEKLLQHHLPEDASYVAVELSTTMLDLARRRLERFGPRVRLRRVDGSPRIEEEDGSFHRFLSTYVFDLLPREEINLLLDEAHRILAPQGLLCLVGLTQGVTPVSRFTSWLWTRVHRLRPQWVGGCRPLVLADSLSPRWWRLEHRSQVVALGVPSEVLVARPTGRRQGPPEDAQGPAKKTFP